MKSRLPSTTERVPMNTDARINERIHREMLQRLSYYTEHPEHIDDRLEALDREWDIERTLEANAASLMVAGTIGGLLSSRKWLVLPLAVSGFLLQHALQGWCPPVPMLRRLGIRTQTEIERERYLLKALRGDMEELATRPQEVNDRQAYLASMLGAINPNH